MSLATEVSASSGTQFNKSIDEATGGTYTGYAQSWTAAYSLTDRLGGYTEYYGFYPSGADAERVKHYFNGGFTYLVNKDMRLDIRGGKGLNDAAADYFVGTGITVRFR